jgi:hypothetical protein
MLEPEIKHIWRSKWSGTKVVYLFIRYMPFLEATVLFYRTVALGVTPEACSITYKISTVFILLGIILGEIVLSARTWAVWKRNRLVGIFLVVFSFIIATSGIAITTVFSGTAKFIEPPYQPYPGCFLGTGSRLIISLTWIDLMVYDGCLLILMILSVRVWSGSTFRSLCTASECNELLGSMIRQGIMYYFYLFILSASNVAVIFILGPDFLNLLTMMERSTHSILTCRIMLQLKEKAKTNTEIFPTLTTELEFVSYGSSAVEA